MRCIFCKQNSDSSKSVEHIVPESLGNIEHILPPGVVCDRCNNYFARKVEGPLLSTEYFIHARSKKTIPNKRGRIPSIRGFHLESLSELEIIQDKSGVSVCIANDNDSGRFTESVMNRNGGSIIIPVPEIPKESLVSRFLGKVAIEALAQCFIGIEGWEEEIIDKPELDPLRNYVRLGNTQKTWEFSQRIIYSEERTFPSDNESGDYEILHEYSLLYTDSKELYLVIAIFGVEYVINMVDPDISSYAQWLQDNNEISPLYIDTNLPGHSV